MRYKPEERLEIAKAIAEGQLTINEASEKYGIHKSEIQRWAAEYTQHGAEGIIKKKVKYDGNFKKTVVEDMRTNGLSLRETAVKYKLGNHNVVAAWERIYLTEGIEGLSIERRGKSGHAVGVRKGRLPKSKEDDLIAENQRLRMELDYLKKLNALVRERQHPGCLGEQQSGFALRPA